MTQLGAHADGVDVADAVTSSGIPCQSPIGVLRHLDTLTRELNAGHLPADGNFASLRYFGMKPFAFATISRDSIVAIESLNRHTVPVDRYSIEEEKESKGVGISPPLVGYPLKFLTTLALPSTRTREREATCVVRYTTRPVEAEKHGRNLHVI